jgi:hypothetical protein
VLGTDVSTSNVLGTIGEALIKYRRIDEGAVLEWVGSSTGL